MQRDRVFHRQLSARSDGEMRCMQRVAEKLDIFKVPIVALHQKEIDPARLVGKQRRLIQILLKYLLKIITRLLVAHRGEGGFFPGLLVAFDNERAGSFVELVRVGSENTIFILAKDKRQTMK